MSVEHFLARFFREPVQFTILTKGLLPIAVPLVAQLVFFGLIAGVDRREQDADRRHVHTLKVIEQADRVLMRLVDVQTGSRGFVLTENPAFTEPYDRVVRELPKDLAALQELVSDSPSQRAAAELIAGKVAQYLEYQAENVRLVESGAQDEAITRIAALTGKSQMDGLRREIAAFRAAELRLEEERRRLVESARTSFRWVLAIGTGASLLLALAMAVAFTRGISRRLDTVTGNVQSLAQGTELAPPVDGSDEIATVDRAFREMAQSLAESREELTKHNRVLQSMLDNMGDGVVVADEAGKFLVFNRAAEHILGVGPTEGGPREWTRQYHVYLPDQTTPFPPEQLPLARALCGEEVDAEELFVRNPGQSEGTWITVTARPLRDAQGLTRGGVAVFQDVTQRKQAEAELDRFFNLSLDMLCIAKADGYFKRINPAFSQILGWSEAEILARPFLDFVHPDDRAATLRVVDEMVGAGLPLLHFENRYQHKDGSWRVLSWKSVPQPGGFMYATGRDVTQFKQNEKAMVDLKAALDEHAIVAITDARGQITFVNDKFCAISQYSCAELIGQDHRIINSGHHPKAFIRELWETITSGRVWKGEIKNRAKDGSYYWVDTTIVPFCDTDGVPTQYIAIRADISERKSVEEQLLQAWEAAESANQAKSEFLASMSHELRTPLNGILGMNELLMNTELTQRQRQFVEACSTSGKALLLQINDVLDLSKIEAGKLELDLHECNLEALVYDIADVFSHSTQQKGYPLHCHIDPAACVTALCDGNRVRQILVNLIGNAMKFTKSGAVTVRAVCVQQLDRQLALRFSVTDTGVGIPEDRRDRLFAPFSQVDSSTFREFGGTGLGLSICKQLVELMGGRIGVESQVGVGSTFWFEVSVQLAAEDTTVAKFRHVLAGKRVLAVDGIDRERKQIGDSLQAWECPCEQVATLTEALEAVARAEAAGDPFAVVLADCRLAVGDEYVLLQKLAKNSRRPIIGLGTDPDDESIAYLHQLGARHILRDPVRPSALFNALVSVLSVDAARQPPDDEPGQACESQQSLLTGHVLVAEDNHINQMYIAELLKYCGCTCDLAANGDEALEALRQQRYDLIVMDCQMPEMDGFTAAREIRRREVASELPNRLPIIALTANALKGDRERCLEAGMDDYLSKPLQAAQLQTMLAKYLSRTSSPPHTADDEI
jgi:PAS domain S-box-containing protein